MKAVSVYKGNVKDANSNSVNILVEIAVLMKVHSSLIHGKILMFKNTSEIVHDLLIGMSIVQKWRFADLSFVKKKISFNHAIITGDWRKARPDNFVALRLLSKVIFCNEKASTNISTTNNKK